MRERELKTAQEACLTIPPEALLLFSWAFFFFFFFWSDSQVRDWVEASVRVAKRNYMTAVPQFYYRQQRVANVGSVYVGSLQLLLPIFSTKLDFFCFTHALA